MFHLIASPPEIYVARSGVTSLADYENHMENRELKLSLVNNVLNRILVSDTCRMTYQDRVFIQNTLHSLGVTDVKEFMHQVQSSRQETRNVNELIDLYWANSQLLQQIGAYRRRERQPAKERGLLVHERELLRHIIEEPRTYVLTEQEESILHALLQRIGITDVRQWIEQVENVREEIQNIDAWMDIHWPDSPQSVQAAAYPVGEGQTVRERKLKERERELLRYLIENPHTYELTEQQESEVYTLLQRMGITDLKQMFQQVEGARETMQDIDTWIDTYWQESLLRQQTVQKMGRKERAERAGEAQVGQEILWLHQQIMNRLQTGAIYQELSDYILADYTHNATISHAELQVSEQSVMAQNIVLNHLQNMASLREQSLAYHHVNIYELGDVPETYNDDSDATRELAAAVLLHTVNQLYALRFADLSSHKNMWYTLEGAIYHEAENVIRRFEQYHTSMPVRRKEAYYYDQEVQAYQTMELRALQELSLEEGAILERSVVANEQNRERLERLERLQNTVLKQPQSVVVYKRQAMRDALRAIREPDQVVREYMQTEREKVWQEESLFREREVREALDPEAVRIMETIERYRRVPELFTPGAVRAEAQQQFVLDTYHNEIQREQSISVKESGAAEDAPPGAVRGRAWEERLPGTVREMRRHIPGTLVREELLHRRQERVLSEEIVSQLQTMNRSSRVNTREQNETVNRRDVVQKIVTNKVNELHVQQDDEIDRLIADSVRRQIDGVSERVYNKITRRMDAERRRRGL